MSIIIGLNEYVMKHIYLLIFFFFIETYTTYLFQTKMYYNMITIKA